MNNNHIHHGNGSFLELLLLLPFILAFILYMYAAVASSRRCKRWPIHRIVFWGLGLVCAAFSLVGPIAYRSQTEFTFHMLGHLLLGMVAPLFFILAAPMTLVLRTIHVKLARRFIRILKSLPLQALHNPIVASLLNMGGLWILYTTDLYSAMHQYILLHFFIHLHVFLAGCLFTASIIYIDITVHKYRFIYRAIVLVLASASHAILSKYIYNKPPTGVSTEQAEMGGVLMYYGGDVIDSILLLLFCVQWYRAARPKSSMNKSGKLSAEQM